MTAAPRWRRAVLGVLLLAATWLALFGDKTPPGQAAVIARSEDRKPERRPMARQRAASPGAREPATKAAAARHLAALVPRDVLVPAVPHRPAVDLFAPASWAMPAAAAVVAAPAETPPVAPPVPFTVLGKKLEAGRWEVYLAKGDETLIVRQGDVIDGTYSVAKIEPPVLSLVYLPLGQPQTMDMGDFE